MWVGKQTFAAAIGIVDGGSNKKQKNPPPPQMQALEEMHVNKLGGIILASHTGRFDEGGMEGG
jgi:hypothetical protein